MTRMQSVYTSYPHWNVEVPPLPTRSRLFRLEPIGVGTARIESLSSYITRLAEAHCVSLNALLRKEAGVSCWRESDHSPNGLGDWAKQLNGTTKHSSVTAAVIESLTKHSGLHNLTLRPWQNVLSFNQLFRPTKAWCAICYREWLKEGKTLYDPLLWTLEVICICPWHHQQLCNVCPHCNRQLPVLSAHAKPGFCPRCKGWLGKSDNSLCSRQNGKQVIPSAVQARQASIFHSVADLLSRTQELTSQPKRSNFVSLLHKYIKRDAHGSINLFADLVGIWSGTVRRMADGALKPRLEILCQVCSRLNISLFDLLTGAGGEDIPEPVIITLGARTPWSEVKGKLRMAQREWPPPSLEAVAKRLGYYPAKLKSHFPKQCAQIIRWYTSYVLKRHPDNKKIRSIFRQALNEQPPPSLQRVFRRLGCQNTGYYYYAHFPDLCFAVAHRFKAYRNKPFDIEVDRKRLHLALVEEPPPSFSEVARRLNHKRDFVAQKFPELSKAIVSRYLYYRTALRRENAERLRHEIRRAICDITASHLYVSEARVKAHIGQHLPNIGRDSLFKQALREIKAEMGIGTQEG